TYGHKQGDIILKEAAQLMNQRLRKIDSLCRYGGDEFTIILPETNLEGAQQKSLSLQEQVKTSRFTNLIDRKKTFHLSISAGVASISDDITTPEELLLKADKMLYRAKKKIRVNPDVYRN
ncbi:MAG: GGDEF domain-containing protein, partial [Planctomycetota bacterium]